MQNPFTVDAVKLIFQATSGIPRAINILCDSALLYGFAEESQTIDDTIIKNVLSELDLHSFVKKESPNEPNLAPVDSTENSTGTVFSERSNVESLTTVSLNRGTETSTLIKKSYGIVKQRLERIEVKLDILREEITKIRSDFIVAENRQIGDLSTEIEKIRSTLEMIKRSEKQSAHMDREEEGKFLNSDSDSTGKNESKEDN